MEDAIKKASTPNTDANSRAADQGPKSTEAFVGYVENSAATPAAPSSTSADKSASQPATTAKALDRWFRERQQQHHAPSLLDIPNESLVRNAGPLQITGNLTLVSESGSITYSNNLTLCRCGKSLGKPNCDNRHIDAEFFDSGKIYEASDAPASRRPSKLTLSLIKDGPITFRGRLKVRNAMGQECTKLRGALCRCGHSTNKPFCDGSHNKMGFRTG